MKTSKEKGIALCNGHKDRPMPLVQIPIQAPGKTAEVNE